MRIDNTYKAIEIRLRDEKFKVHHLYRDFRGDWGDDGGYIVAICEKKGIIYLHILAVNYNADVSCHILEKDDERVGNLGEREFLDYFICESVEDAQRKINEFITHLEVVVEEVANDRYYFGNGILYPEDEPVPEYFKDFSFQYLSMLAIVHFSYSEYTSIDKPNLLNLTKTPYVPNYESDDPVWYKS